MIIKITANPVYDEVERIQPTEEEMRTMTAEEVAEMINQGSAEEVQGAAEESSLSYMELPDAQAVLLADHLLSYAENLTNDHDSAVLLTELSEAIREAHGKIEGTL